MSNFKLEDHASKHNGLTRCRCGGWIKVTDSRTEVGDDAGAPDYIRRRRRCRKCGFRFTTLEVMVQMVDGREMASARGVARAIDVDGTTHHKFKQLRGLLEQALEILKDQHGSKDETPVEGQ